MVNLLQFTSAWRQVESLIEERKSSILIAPRYYGKWPAIRDCVKQRTNGSGFKCVVVSSRFPTSDGNLEYAALWDSIRSQLGAKAKVKASTRASFIAALDATLQGLDAEVVAIVGGTGRGHEENHYRVMSCFQALLGANRLTIVGTDDYSSFYYQKQNYLLSDLHSLLQVQVGSATEQNVRAYMNSLIASTKLGEQYVDWTAKRVFEISGGHTGIADELIRGLERESWPSSGRDWESCVDGILKRSVILDAIAHALEEDAEGYSRTALEYREATCPEQNSPRIHVLRQLGVLQREAPPLMRLCRGAITSLIERLSGGSPAGVAGRIGTIVSETGPRLFEEGQVHLTDEDLVVIHISDLHVSDSQYRHRLTWKGGQLNPNELSAGELLHDDLESLGLLDRVDGMVVSGDFVCTGSPSEFRRAQTVIEDLIAASNIDLSRILMIPGNHDIEWNPGNLSATSYGKPVSRESYDDFQSLLGKKSSSDTESIELVSRSKNVRLQIQGLDSNRVEGPQAAGIGFVARDSLSSSTRVAAKFQNGPPSPSRNLIWLAVHHHLFPAAATSLADAQARIVSTMANAAEILEHANHLKAELVLHGHEHQPSITVARRWPVDVGSVFAPISSIGAGSYGAKREFLGPFSHNHYYIIIRRPDGILIRSRQQGVGGVRFIGHSDMWLPR